MNPLSLPDEVRAACPLVMEDARWVRVEEATIEPYAAGLPLRGAGEGRRRSPRPTPKPLPPLRSA